MIKKTLSILLSLIIVLGIFTIVPFSVYAENAEGVIASGTTGDCTWTVYRYKCTEYTENGLPYSSYRNELIISGNGAMDGSAPWWNWTISRLTIENGVTYIRGFYSSIEIESLFIPRSVTRIDLMYLTCCETINVDVNNPVYDSRNNCNAIIETNTNTLIKGCRNTVIPTSVTSIGAGAFGNCDDLTSLYIPDTVTYIGSCAFENCDDLTSLYIPDTVTYIGSCAFDGCENLTHINIPNTITDIEYFTFMGCESLKSITIPDSVTFIGSGAFDRCKSLTSVTIPDSVKLIGYGAFQDCTNLETVIFPETAISICGQAFYATAWYDNQPNGLVYAGKAAYKMKGTCPSKVEIKQGTLTIARESFCWGCNNLTDITIPDSVKEIGGWAFVNTGLDSIAIPSSVTSIEDYALGYSGDNYYEPEIKIKDFTIYGHKGTAAESYANRNDFIFIPLPDRELDVAVSSWEAYDEITNEWQYPVEDFDYAMGSFAWDKQNIDPNLNTNDNLIDKTNYDKLYLKVEIEHKENDDSESDVTDAEVSLTAPDGFSFSHTEIDTEYTCTFNDVHQGETKDMAVTIYPIFSLAYQDGQEIKIDTKVTSTLYDETTDTIPIGSIHKRIREGMISVDQYAEPLSVDLKPELFAESPYTYVQELARLGIGLSAMEYASDKQIEDSYRNLGFSQIRIFGDSSGYAGINATNYSFASKRIIINGKIYTLVAVPIRGTVDLNEWIGNANAFEQANGDHSSFRDSANDVEDNLARYLKYTDLSLSEERKFLITGHSRGAAVANLLGADIDNDQLASYADANSTYVYTFATPNTTSDDYISHERYYNIFNIIDYNDVVATVPPRFMGYNKYGLTYSFALNSHYHHYLPQIVENVRQIYTHYTYLEYDPLPELDRITFIYDLAQNILDLFRGSYINTAIATRAVILDSYEYYQRAVCTHSTANYIAWMESLHNQYEMVFSEVNFRRIEVQCPVDVEIIDSTGKTVGKTTNGIVNDSVSNLDGVLLAVDADQKIIILPDIDDYTIKTTGYDDGTMNVTVAEYEDYTKDKVTCYKNAPVSSGKYYTMSIGQTSSDYLFRSDTGTLVAADKIYDKDQLNSIEISVMISGNGKVKGDGAYTPGEIAVLTALPTNSEFRGWYLGDDLISKETEISFVTNESVTYEARFTDKTNVHFNLGDVDGSGKVDIVDATFIQRFATEIKTPFDEEIALYGDVDGNGKSDIVDATFVQRYATEITTPYPIGK